MCWCVGDSVFCCIETIQPSRHICSTVLSSSLSCTRACSLSRTRSLTSVLSFSPSHSLAYLFAHFLLVTCALSTDSSLFPPTPRPFAAPFLFLSLTHIPTLSPLLCFSLARARHPLSRQKRAQKLSRTPRTRTLFISRTHTHHEHTRT